MKYIKPNNKKEKTNHTEAPSSESKANGFKWWLTNKTKKGKNKLKKNPEEQVENTKKSKPIVFENNYPNKTQIELQQKHDSVHKSMIDYLENSKASKKSHDLYKFNKIKIDNEDVIEVHLFNNTKFKISENLINSLKEKIVAVKCNESEVLVYSDGGCNVNSNSLAVCGITLAINSNDISTPIFSVSVNIGPGSTSNTAEYMGLILSLVFVKILFHNLKFKKLKLFSDSELVVRQMTGVYQVKKPHISCLYGIASSLVTKIKSDIDCVENLHIRRSLNKEADKLSKYAKEMTDNTLTVFY